MTRRAPKNQGASIRQRLLNHAREVTTDYNQLLIRYAIERFLYRLSVSPHRNSFVLKGAMLFAVWKGTPHRPTQDLDLLGFGERSDKRLVEVFRELCSVVVEDDGLTFDPSTVATEAIRPEDDYGGMRVTLSAELGGAILRLQIDIGFGDAISPAAVEANYPNILANQPQAHLRTYPRETVVAEKLEAIVTLGMLNTRFKDYYDLFYLSRTFDFDGPTLASAISNTFERRQTPLPKVLPVGLTKVFASDQTKQIQWLAFLRRLGEPDMPQPLAAIVKAIGDFIEPVLSGEINKSNPLSAFWIAPGPWTSNGIVR